MSSRSRKWMLVTLSVAAALLAVRAARRRPWASDWLADADSSDQIQVELDDSFPASDPPSHTSTTGATVDPSGIH